MSNNRFFEGLIMGTIIGTLGMLLLSKTEEETIQVSEDGTENNQPKSTKKTINLNQSTEEVVAKTLQAIETGFDKITKMVDEQKKDNKKKSSKAA